MHINNVCITVSYDKNELVTIKNEYINHKRFIITNTLYCELKSLKLLKNKNVKRNQLDTRKIYKPNRLLQNESNHKQNKNFIKFGLLNAHSVRNK